MNIQYRFLYTIIFSLTIGCLIAFKVLDNTILDEVKFGKFDQIEVEGELKTRLLKNFDRLEDSRYQPQNVFLSDEQSGFWPGDTEGRTILGLVLDAQVTKRQPKYLEEIIRLIPQKLNSKGYMGRVHPVGIMDEQQFSGNGWMLRGL